MFGFIKKVFLTGLTILSSERTSTERSSAEMCFND